MAVGIILALLYFGILAFAGIFISGAVNSLEDRSAVAHATMQRLTGAASDSAGDAVEAPVSESSHNAPQGGAPLVPSAIAAVPPPAVARALPASPAVAVVASPPPAPAPALQEPSAAISVPPPVPASPQQNLAAVPSSPPVPVVPQQSAAVLPDAAPPPAAASDASELRAYSAAGDARLADGDIASARLYYERAAEAGDPRAARLLGNSYDSAFLVRWGVRGMSGDKDEATRWYKLAGALGDSEAKQDLAALAQH